MHVFFKRLVLLFITVACFTCPVLAQQITLQGKVIGSTDRETLVGVNIIAEGTSSGTTTDPSGGFTLTLPKPGPYTVVFSFVGYKPFRKTVTESMYNTMIALEEDIILGKEIVISASMMEESIMKSPATMEKLTVSDIRRMPSANFYDGLSVVKGVDMSVHSLLFKSPNTRGFNSNSGIRMNQFIDGMDNAAPGLNFAAGNIFGVNQLDLESVELLVGASSALYGPGSMNGTLLMTTKNPFEYQGLAASVQLGAMNINAPDGQAANLMEDVKIRYAKAFNDRLAFKMSVGYINASDWRASDYRDRTNPSLSTLNRQSNPGYDGVNAYGDDIIVPVTLKSSVPDVVKGIADSQNIEAGTSEYESLEKQVADRMPDQIISRTGYAENDLVNYGTRNLRVNSAVHYRFRKSLEAIAQIGYSNGTSLYTTDSRFAMKNFSIVSGRLEIKSPHFYVRTYSVFENAGDSYDIANTGLLLNETWKSSEQWYKDYIQAFIQTRLLDGSAPDNPNWSQLEARAYDFARQIADNRDRYGNKINNTLPARPLPGQSEFNTVLNSIIRRPVNEGGSKVIDKTRFWHVEGMYNFTKLIKFIELIVGTSYRLYTVDSRGTIFADSPGNPIFINQIGVFTQLSKKIFNDRVKLLGSARYDKNEFFKGRITPRFSAVYSIDKEAHHNVRASFQTAFRFPTIANQWIDLNTGRYQIIGGQSQLHNQYNFSGSPVYPLSSTNPITGTPLVEQGPFKIPTFKPEQVNSIEVGYKGLHLSGKVLIDGYVYGSRYNNFLAQQALAQNPNTPEEKRYLTTISTNFPINTYGWALGVDVLMLKGFVLKTNVSYNTYVLSGNPPTGFQANFNTPAYRYNVALYNRGFIKNMDFSINWRWQQKYRWESGFGIANIPAFGTLDAAINMKLPRVKSMVKIGGSNLLNKYYTTSLGSAQVGGLYYVTWSFGSI